MGEGKDCDPLSDFFISTFENYKLQDISPFVLSPTWSNKRVGALAISKRLDRFFMSEALCEKVGKYRSWHQSTGISDHRAIILQVEFERVPVVYPFNFNPKWLTEEHFCTLVKNMWQQITVENQPSMSPIKALLHKLEIL